MKYTLFIVVVLGVFFYTSCSSPFADLTPEEAAYADSADSAYRTQQKFTLENLLVMDIYGLEGTYGKENVTFDTIWGAEGYFSMGTILKTEPQSHIEITWDNETTKTHIISVTQVSDSDWYADTLTRSQWRSTYKVTLGISIQELQKLNERPFTFSGFGWDYAGSVLDWQKGILEGKGIAVQLSEGPTNPSTDLTPDEIASVLGDVQVQSDNPALKHYRPRVWSISVAKVQ